MSVDPNTEITPDVWNGDIGGHVYYSCDEYAERLTATTVYDAVIEHVDQWETPPTRDDIVKVTAFRRMALPSRENIAENALEHVLLSLDDEYGDDEGDSYSDAAAALKDDALAFTDAVRAKYVPWACEPHESFMVNVAEYVPSEWLRDRTDNPTEAP